jgi:phospholipid/cholesterol/gamma-HCH transport system ATP-binding protein
MIEFKNVKKRFGNKQVLDGLSFKVSRSEIVFLLGRSGAGKSVVLKHLVGLVQPDSGEVWVDGENVTHFSESAFFAVRKRCGMVFQFPALIDSLTVFDNVAFGLRAHSLTDKQNEKDFVLEKLGLVGLGEKVLEKRPSELSFGTQKRVSIARTLAIQPSYLLFDEPTTGLDPVSTHSIHALIQNLSRKLKVTCLVVSHDMGGALSFADRIVLLDGGKVAVAGTPEDLKASTYPLARQFLEVV